MINKPRIDWEAVERDYRIGQMSVRELARRHEIEPSTITRRAKKEAWIRDLSEIVKSRTRAAMIETVAQHTQQHATESNTALRDGIDVAVETNLRVLRAHQSGIRESAGRLERLAQQFDAISAGLADMNDIAKAASSLESIVRSQKTLVGLEREALNIDDRSDSATDAVEALRKLANGEG